MGKERTKGATNKRATNERSDELNVKEDMTLAVSQYVFKLIMAFGYDP